MNALLFTLFLAFADPWVAGTGFLALGILALCALGRSFKHVNNNQNGGARSMPMH